MFVEPPSNFQENLYYDGIHTFYYSFVRERKDDRTGIIVDTKIQDNEVFVYIPKEGWDILSMDEYERVKIFLESI